MKLTINGKHYTWKKEVFVNNVLDVIGFIALYGIVFVMGAAFLGIRF